VLVVLKPLQFGPDAPTKPPFRLLRQLVPPQTAMMTYVALEPANTYIDTGDDGTATTGAIELLDAPDISGTDISAVDYEPGPVTMMAAENCSP